MTANEYNQQLLLIELGAPIPEGFTIRFESWEAAAEWCRNRHITAPASAFDDILRLTIRY